MGKLTIQQYFLMNAVCRLFSIIIVIRKEHVYSDIKQQSSYKGTVQN